MDVVGEVHYACVTSVSCANRHPSYYVASASRASTRVPGPAWRPPPSFFTPCPSSDLSSCGEGYLMVPGGAGARSTLRR